MYKTKLLQILLVLLGLSASLSCAEEIPSWRDIQDAVTSPPDFTTSSGWRVGGLINSDMFKDTNDYNSRARSLKLVGALDELSVHYNFNSKKTTLVVKLKDTQFLSEVWTRKTIAGAWGVQDGKFVQDNRDR